MLFVALTGVCKYHFLIRNIMILPIAKNVKTCYLAFVTPNDEGKTHERQSTPHLFDVNYFVRSASTILAGHGTTYFL